MEVNNPSPKIERIHSASAYMLFCKEKRSSITQKLPVMKASDVTALLSELWRKLPEEKKQIYREKAMMFKCSPSSHYVRPNYNQDFEHRTTLCCSESNTYGIPQFRLRDESKIQLNRYFPSYCQPIQADASSPRYSNSIESGSIHLVPVAQISQKVNDIPPLITRGN